MPPLRLVMAAASRKASGLLSTTGTSMKLGISRVHNIRPIGAIVSRRMHTCNPLWEQSSSAFPNPSSIDDQNAAGSGIIDSMARKFREVAPGSTETYRAYSRGKELYLECAKQGAYLGEGGKVDMGDKAKFWYIDCDRSPTFNAWAQVTMLHMWTLITRFRAYPDKETHDVWQQHFIDHFFYDAEEKMLKEYNIKSNGLRSKYLKDLFVVYRGTVAAYDEALARYQSPFHPNTLGKGEAEGDAVLATAIWRNVFDAKENTDLAMLAAVTAYVRRIVSGLDRLPDETVMEAAVVFGDPRREIGSGLEESGSV